MLTNVLVAVPPLSPAMDRTLQRLASALGMFVDCRPQWPRSDALGCAEAIAQDLLNLVRTDPEPELAFDTRGRRPSIATLRQWQRTCYNQTMVIKTIRKQLFMLRSGRRLGKHLRTSSVAWACGRSSG